jgi:polygalacturonase
MSCDDVTIENIVIDNHFYGPNTDGIDVNGCRDVTIRGCRVRCGDDAIILKASKEAGRSCERVVISDCLVETHCAAVGLGAEVSFPIRDVSVSNVVVGRALRMLQIELWNAGLVENVVVSGMTGANMTDIPLERPLYIDIQHHGRSDGALGAVRNVQIRGVTATTRGRCLFTAADGSTIEGLILDGIQLTIPEIEDPQESVVSSRSSQMSNDSPETRAARAAFVFDNVRDADVSGVQIRWPDRDRGDRAATMRQDFDRGELSRDRRKREALGGDPPMHALMLRNCSALQADVPNLRGFKAAAVSTIGEIRDCEIRSAEGTYE